MLLDRPNAGAALADQFCLMGDGGHGAGSGLGIVHLGVPSMA